jgi:hypothetical protein
MLCYYSDQINANGKGGVYSRMQVKTDLYKNFVKKRERKKLIFRGRSTSKDNIKMEFIELGLKLLD